MLPRPQDLLKNIYNNATSMIKIKTNKIRIKREVSHGDTISPKLNRRCHSNNNSDNWTSPKRVQVDKDHSTMETASIYRSADRLQKGWLDDIRENAGRDWHQMAHDKEAWKT